MRETDALLLERLKRPEGKIDVALDTDTYNEIDDQFALAYLLSSPEKMNVKAIYAAPFHNEKSDGPADGMEKSFQEIHRILGLMGREELKERVFRGARSYLADETQPVSLRRRSIWPDSPCSIRPRSLCMWRLWERSQMWPPQCFFGRRSGTGSCWSGWEETRTGGRITGNLT